MDSTVKLKNMTRNEGDTYTFAHCCLVQDLEKKSVTSQDGENEACKLKKNNYMSIAYVLIFNCDWGTFLSYSLHLT